RHAIATHVEIGHAESVSAALNQNGAIVLAGGGQSAAQRRAGEIGLSGSEGQASLIQGNVRLRVGIPLRDGEREGHGGTAAVRNLEALHGGQGTRRLENAERDGRGGHGDAGGKGCTGIEHAATHGGNTRGAGFI